MTEPGISNIGPGRHVAVNINAVDTAGADGVVWGVASPQLNANLVKLKPSSEIGSHTNNEVDVLVVVQTGRGQLFIDGTDHPLSAGSVVLVPTGAERSILATTELTYLSIHTRRSGLTIG